jgi:predicted nucleotidyltransferase/uncharacterized protein with HEPN domain
METLAINLAPLARDEAMRTLEAHEAELRALGVVRLALFGSTVRDEARPDSDVDVLVEYDENRRLSLLDIAGLQQRLSDLFGRDAELADRRRLKPFLKDRILAEAVEVFPRFGHRDPLPEGRRMPPRNPRQRLQDMLDAITFVETRAAGRTLDGYLADDLLRAAIERKVEIVSEASQRVPADLLDAHPDIPWAKIHGIGNILRHEYDDVYPAVIWTIAAEHMAPLRRAVEAMIAAVETAAKG